MKNTTIQIKARRTNGGDYVIESIRGKASLKLQWPPPCSDRQHVYLVGNTIVQEEADAIAMEFDLTVLAMKD